MGSGPNEYFLARMRALYDKKMPNSIMMDKNEYHSKLSRLVELTNAEVKRVPNDFRLMKSYELVVDMDSEGAVPKLSKRGTNLIYVPIEDMYDVIHRAHIELGHVGRNGLQNFLRNRYCNITKESIMEYLSTCKGCPRKRRPTSDGSIKHPNESNKKDNNNPNNDSDVNCSESIYAGDRNDTSDVTVFEESGVRKSSTSSQGVVAVNTTILATTPLSVPFIRTRAVNNKRESEKSSVGNSFTRGQVDIFDMTNTPDGEFQYILCYMNLSTREVRLRPLRSNSIADVANSLIDIYCDIGAPIVLQSSNTHDFNEQLVIEIAKLWPNCKQICASNQAPISLSDLKEKLIHFINKHNTTRWAGLLRFLQWEYNIAHDTDLGSSPFERSLGKPPQLGLPSSKLLSVIYEKARSEEQILELLKDAEILRLSVFSQQNETSSSFFQQPLEKRLKLNNQLPSIPLNLADVGMKNEGAGVMMSQTTYINSLRHHEQLPSMLSAGATNIAPPQCTQIQNLVGPETIQQQMGYVEAVSQQQIIQPIQNPTMLCSVSNGAHGQQQQQSHQEFIQQQTQMGGGEQQPQQILSNNEHFEQQQQQAQQNAAFVVPPPNAFEAMTMENAPPPQPTTLQYVHEYVQQQQNNQPTHQQSANVLMPLQTAIIQQQQHESAALMHTESLMHASATNRVVDHSSLDQQHLNFLNQQQQQQQSQQAEIVLQQNPQTGNYCTMTSQPQQQQTAQLCHQFLPTQPQHLIEQQQPQQQLILAPSGQIMNEMVVVGTVQQQLQEAPPPPVPQRRASISGPVERMVLPSEQGAPAIVTTADGNHIQIFNFDHF